MRSVEETPTKPIDYAALSATYGSLLGTVVLAARQRDGRPIRPGELPILGVAAFALSKLVAKEKVETWVREPFVDESSQRPKGRRLRYAVGELLTCTRCLGAWSSLGLVALRVARPEESRVISAVLVTSAVNDWLQTGFSWLCAAANDRDARAKNEQERPAGSAASVRRLR